MSDDGLTRISEHVYWLPPGAPDRPALCAVVGAERTLLLDAGSSAAHLSRVLDGLATLELEPPSMVVLSHWHWDHVFASGETDALIVAHERTAAELRRLAAYAWDDAALDARAAAGIMTFSAEHIREELPAPRTVRIGHPAITFSDSLTLHSGGNVTCRVQHVGGDHSDDSCVVLVEPDKVLFLSDCLYDAVYAPVRHYTPAKLLPLIEALRAFDADLIIEGHNPEVTRRAAFRDLTNMMLAAARLVCQHGADEDAVFAAARAAFGDIDEDTADVLRALIAGVGG